MQSKEQSCNSLSRTISGTVTAALATTIVLALMLTFTQSASAQTFKVIHTFTGGQDGGQPVAGLTMDRGGNLYGTTAWGGSLSLGTVFKLSHKDPGWDFTSLYSFQGGADGISPGARLIIGPDGSLYGTTVMGGGDGCGGPGCGTVFKLQPSLIVCGAPPCPWKETVLYRFTGGWDGSVPSSGALTFDQLGNIYGTTRGAPHPTSRCPDSLGCGVVFELTPSSGGWTESVLYTFPGGKDGGVPYGGVIFDQAGNLYGTTEWGGDLGCFPPYGCGTIFQLTPSGSGWTEKVLHSLEYESSGAEPVAGLIFDQTGNLYGTSFSGGSGLGGTAFQLSSSDGGWMLTRLYSFSGSGEGPLASLVMDAANNLYGTTYGDGYGYGSVFKLTPSAGSWTYTSLHYFTFGSDGGNPTGDVILDANGSLYGTTPNGGTYYRGVVFEITP
jgi:uncharacterized repeat protein (TIGR03803 family)